MVVASFYLEQHDAATVAAALNYIVTWLYQQRQVVWEVAVSMQDDSMVEYNAIRQVWPKATIRLCVWHIAHRNVQARVTGYFTLGFALTVVKVVWDLVRRAGHRAVVTPLQLVCHAVDFLVGDLKRRELWTDVDPDNKYHPERVKERLMSGAWL